ncbi:type III secretion system chaperone [Pseudooceanicola aestuarii]|uniref:type III secretion system chaperone n=1 Tax=Pseudooceanicola aestuarii TaxID=2697319 RepID=UPI0013D7E7BF|nr:type III secretion system chaperone [Pseudooceanicola aestuarii]
MDFNDLMMAFGQQIGILELGQTDDGITLEIADRTVVLRHEPPGGRVTIIADVAAYPRAHQAALAPALLELNFASALVGGHSLAADPSEERCFCVVSLLLDGLSVDTLDAEIARLVTKAGIAADLIERRIAILSEAPGDVAAAGLGDFAVRV